MNAVSVTSALGLIGLVSGVIVVNVASTPSAAQAGGITVGLSVLLLVFVAIGRLLG
jgi:hypothetical protein